MTSTIGLPAETMEHIAKRIGQSSSVGQLKSVFFDVLDRWCANGECEDLNNSGIPQFLHRILSHTLNGEYTPPPAITAGGSFFYELDALAPQLRNIPDTWEVWRWSPELETCHTGRLVTAVCPGVGPMSVIAHIN